MPIGEKDHGPLTVHLLQTICIQAGLLLPDTSIHTGFLGFHYRQRLAVVIPQYVVAIALGGNGWLMQNLHLLANRVVARRACRYGPAG